MTAVRPGTVGFARPAAVAAALVLAVLVPHGVPAAEEPSLNAEASKVIVPVGASVGVSAPNHFDNAGTNPRLTEMTFSTTEYYGDDMPGIVDGVGYFRVKSNDELNALPDPPPSPFTVDMTLKMENDEGQTATGTVELETSYEREGAPAIPVLPAPVDLPPIPTELDKKAPPGKTTDIDVDEAFDHAGTNPRFTAAVFSETDYYDESGIVNGSLQVTVKTSADLLAMTPPPPDPFTVMVDVTMENDEGETATGRVALKTEYN